MPRANLLQEKFFATGERDLQKMYQIEEVRFFKDRLRAEKKYFLPVVCQSSQDLRLTVYLMMDLMKSCSFSARVGLRSAYSTKVMA